MSDDLAALAAEAYIYRFPLVFDMQEVSRFGAMRGFDGFKNYADVLADPEYTWGESIRRGGFRTMLGIPLLREGIPIGVIAACRSTVAPFAAKQIELVTTFADQAVIAIENVRLFNALEERTRELTRSVEELRALGEVGQAVSRSLDRRPP